MITEDPRLGTTVGEKYRVQRFIAEGGMGAVYEAQHAFVRRRFAIKFLRRELARRRDLLARFAQEARAAGALEHENIAAVVDFGIDHDGAPYLVMEFLDGMDLGQLLGEHGPLPGRRAADLVRQAAIGVQVAHAASLIHRDLKPQNLFLCRRSDGSDLVKLLDFGVAKLDTPDGAVTRTGDRLGTPAYMSPEQARGEATIDGRTDVYALGVILYELLSGRTPHPGDSHNAVIHHIATDRFIPLTSAGGEFPPGLVDLVHRTISADPALRPASAEELANALLPWASRDVWPAAIHTGESGKAAIESTLLAAPQRDEAAAQNAAGSSHDLPERSQVAPPRSARRPLVAVGLAGLVAVVAWSLGRPKPPGTEGARIRTEAPSSLAAFKIAGSDIEPPVVPTPREPAGPPARPSVEPAPARATRPRPRSERPRGRPPESPSVSAAARASATSDEAGVIFDHENPYK